MAKDDPRLAAAARELKDRWLQELAAGRYLPGGRGKYAVGWLVGERMEIGTGELPGKQVGAAMRIAA
jgi:hypothetical protein